MKRTDVRDIFEYVFIFFVALVFSAFVFLIIGCSYTAPSKASPDLIEKVSNGHVICYYRDGKRAVAKCCEDCPMHDNAVTTR